MSVVPAREFDDDWLSTRALARVARPPGDCLRPWVAAGFPTRRRTASCRISSRARDPSRPARLDCPPPARAGRALLLRHDDARRPGHVGAARGAVDAARPRSTRRRGEPAAYAICRPPGHHATRAGYGGSCYLNNAAVAAAALRDAGVDRSRSSTSTPTTATAPRRSSTTGPTSSTAPFTSTRVPAGSRTTSASPTRPGAARARAPTSTCRSPPAPAMRPGCALSSAPRRRRASGARPRGLARGGRRGRRSGEPAAGHCRGLPESGGVLAALGLPTVVVQEGGYHLPTLGQLVGSALDGLGSG